MPIAPYKGAKRKTVEYAKIIILGKVFLNLSHMSGGVTSLGEGGGGGNIGIIRLVRTQNFPQN